ncbi:MAG: diacylglycerol kinase family protein [Candidatus Pacebacteria bacterium]|jgi:diacylglycerol kinase|nr:diacylglycerol kinase family protein [Candidatus Paceibacterota bacterium]
MLIDFKKLSSSLKFALSGLKDIFREENAFKLELLLGIIVAAAAFYFNLSTLEKVAVFIVIFFVLFAELINSVVERIMDVYSPEFDSRVKKIKDICSAIVLLSCIMAAIVGIFIFIDKLPI